MPVTFDETFWPLVITRYTAPLTDQEHAQSLERFGAYLEQGEPYFCIVDTRHLIAPTPQQRQLQEQWDREYAELVRTTVLGTALIVTSPVIRLTVSILLHLRPMLAPYVMVSDMQAALDWVTARMEAQGLEDCAERIRVHFAPPPLKASG
jgi:hypothetical protein